jgi:hypothetical protein
MLWVLNQSDGNASLLDIAQRSGLGFPAISLVARELETAALLRVADESDPARKTSSPRKLAQSQPRKKAQVRSTRRKRPDPRSTRRRK